MTGCGTGVRGGVGGGAVESVGSGGGAIGATGVDSSDSKIATQLKVRRLAG